MQTNGRIWSDYDDNGDKHVFLSFSQKWTVTVQVRGSISHSVGRVDVRIIRQCVMTVLLLRCCLQQVHLGRGQWPAKVLCYGYESTDFSSVQVPTQPFVLCL